jgi:hypothetical protein
VLEVAVGDPVGVAVLDAFADLSKELASFFLRESVDILGAEVGEEVSTLNEFCYEVGFSANVKLFNETGDVGTALAYLHGGGLADFVFAGQARVVGGLDGLDGDFEAGDAVACEPDWVAGAFANYLSDIVLFELRLKALGGLNSYQSFFALGACLKKDGAAFVMGQNHL